MTNKPTWVRAESSSTATRQATVAEKVSFYAHQSGRGDMRRLELALLMYCKGYISRADFVAATNLEAQTQSVVDDRYPHVCPKCSRPAYIGLSQVDCSGGCK